MWNPGWDDVFRLKEWGKHPPEELVRFMARNFPDIARHRTTTVLEIGCGTGANLIFLAQEGFVATGLDGSSIALERAASHLAQRGVHARLDQGDAGRLPYPNGTFDCAIDVECIYANTLADSHRIIAEIHRVLTPGGLFFSKTFATGTSGETTGVRMVGEPNTFLAIPDGPFNAGYGVIRLTAEKEIPDLYGIFMDLSYDYSLRSDHGRARIIKEWLIACRKSTVPQQEQG